MSLSSDQVKHLAAAALAIGIAAPPPRNKDRGTYLASIPWELVEQIRKVMDEAHVEWRRPKQKKKETP